VPDVFISYRREDSSGYAGRLYDQVSSHFGQEHVFMDVADLEPGSDFVETIEKKVSTCDALIALIGKNWLTIKDEQNRIRISKPGDFVSVEIAAALSRNIEVIPVLVGGAKMPVQRELPESLQSLSRRQALELSDVHFTRDVADLVEALKRPAGSRVARSSRWLKLTLAGSVGAISLLAAGIGIWTWQNPSHSREPVRAPGSSVPNTKAASPADPSNISDNADISGNWRAVVQKGDVKYEIYFTFQTVGDKLLGSAIYPTGEGGILNGTIAQKRISFTTKHVPNFAEEEATITVEGEILGDEIRVFTQDKDGYSKGIAHRVARVSRAKVLTP
jgi:hypothetical protein